MTIPRPTLIKDLYDAKHYPSFLDIIGSETLKEQIKQVVESELNPKEKVNTRRLKCYWCDWYYLSAADHKRHGIFCP